MESYVEIKNRQQQERNEFPFGFAFGNDQFEEMMKKWGLNLKSDLKKVVALGAGCYVQKKDYDSMNEMLRRHKKERKDAITADETGDGYIYEMFLYELGNHEFGYTGDPSETICSLGLTYAAIEANPALNHGFEKAKKEILHGED